MPIISTIGRRSWQVRALIVTIYVLLIIGSVTMIYPFLLMMAGSTQSAVDRPETKVIPRFLVDDRALYQKYAEGVFDENLDTLRFTYGLDAPSFAKLDLPPPPRTGFVKCWTDFLAHTPLPSYAYSLGFIYTPQSRGVLAQTLRAFRGELMAEYDDELGRLNRALGCEFASWNTFYLLPQGVWMPQQRPGATPLHERFEQFKQKQPFALRYYVSIEGYFKTQLLQNRYGKDIAPYNKSHGTAYASWAEVHLDRRLPTGPGRTDKERQDWTDFVRSLLNHAWIRADDAAAPAYQAFLLAKYGDLATINKNYQTHHTQVTDIPILAEPPTMGLIRSDWDAFIEGWKDPATQQQYQAPADQLRVHTVEFLFRDYLEKQFDSIAAFNAALGTDYRRWIDVLPPQQDLHYQVFLTQRNALRWEFVQRNYYAVIDYIALHGNAVYNTLVYCTLLIAVTLVVNPIAAYALSRYRPASTYKILLFLMMTMAFPPMVTQIPVFLMLREFHMLNTFWALILPGIANGYNIFLLKGFFDSLPRELYESAELDGASEFRIFWQLTMSLSKPILAVIALGAFTQAYSNFMYALLICQDVSMWTLMPWLYQLQQRSFQGVVYASLLITSVPTFVLFVFCQKIIMRGIVVPVEK